MPAVQGRIDHMSIDTKNERLFVAALGNNTLEVIDLKAGKLANSIPGLNEPQGVLYVPALDRLYVANAKDGTVRIFDGSSFKLIKNVSYGDDADNIRFDSVSGTVYIGYGSGALGAIDKVERLPTLSSMRTRSRFSLKRTGQESSSIFHTPRKLPWLIERPER